MDIFNILITGVGGQGILLASDITANAAMKEGHDVKKSEIHGMSQRGGSVFSHIRFGKKVYSPVIPGGKTDIIISFEEMESIRWPEYIGEATRFYINNNRIMPEGAASYPDGIISSLEGKYKKVVTIDQEKLLKIIGKPKYLNTAILGIASNDINFNEESWKAAINEESPKGTYEENFDAFCKGRNFLKKK